jgi:hypothetical protein
MATQPPAVLANPTPKARFLQVNPAHTISKHREMVDSDTFQRAADAALLQYQIALAEQIRDGNTAATSGFKMQGVIEFLQLFRNLSETPIIPMPIRNDNLKHEN